ncbi:MAG: hypothetical protein M3Y53_10405 [Thermoproteota archaeon]|nr:hypothetical protein [Thermoproteota archaeon]
MQQNSIQGSAANAGVENGCCIAGAFAAQRVLFFFPNKVRRSLNNKTCYEP